jgi:hypothetical protein
MKNMDIRVIYYKSASPTYWRFMRVDVDDFSELHLGHYSTIMEPAFENCILYPPSMNREDGTIRMCKSCDDHFNSSSTKFPSWILANNLTLLPLPENLKDIKDTEIQLVTPILRTHNIATFSSGNTDKNTFIRSHVYTYGAYPNLAISTVPFDMLSTKAFNISIVGAYTTDIKALVAAAYEVRPKKSLMHLTLCQERKNAAVMEKTCDSLMNDIMGLASSIYLFLIFPEFNSNFADIVAEDDADLSGESHGNMPNPHNNQAGTSGTSRYIP